MSIQLLNQRKISDHKKLRSLCSDLVVCVLLSWTWVRVTNLDVRLDCDFILDKHINSIIKASFYHFINFSFQTFSKIQIHFPPPNFGCLILSQQIWTTVMRTILALAKLPSLAYS